MLKRFAPVACLLLGVALAAPADAEPFEDEARQFVGSAFRAAAGLTKKAGKDQVNPAARFANFIESRLATKALARFVLGPYWRRASEAERTEFHSLFRTYLSSSFGQQAARLASQPVKIDKVVKATGNDVLVFSRMGQRGPAALHIDWRIRRTKNGPKLVDVIVQGTSLAVAQRQQFQNIMLRNGGSIAALNAQMKTRFKTKPGDAPPRVARKPARKK